MGRLVTLLLILIFVLPASGFWVIGKFRERKREIQNEFMGFGPFGFGARAAAVGETCWYPDYYCSITSGNRLEVSLIDGIENCYNECQANDACKFFTSFKRRMKQFCYLLRECGPSHQINDDACLLRGTCTSGPSDCDSLSGDNKPCPQLMPPEDPKGVMWQCEDGKRGKPVNPYQGDIGAGARCFLSCASWVSERRHGEIYDGVEAFRGFLFSHCQPNGNWSAVLPNDFRDGMVDLAWPSPAQLNLSAYPTPDQPINPPCNCRTLAFVWPPSGHTSNVPSFYYNPRLEKGTDMECEAEVSSPVSSPFLVVGTNLCRMFCDNYLVSTIKCVSGTWLGGLEEGFWCYDFPKFGDRLGLYPGLLTPTGTNMSSCVQPSCGDKCVDGLLTGGAGCRTQNYTEDVAPWLALEFLSGVVEVTRVTLYNSQEGANTIRDCRLTVADTKPSTTSTMFNAGTMVASFSGPATDSQVVDLSAAGKMPKATHLVIQCNSSDVLHFKEVKVFGIHFNSP